MNEKNPEMENLPVDEITTESEYYTLTDEDGNELQFEVIGSAELNGNMYYAMIPADEEPTEDGIFEYVILRADKDEDGEDILVTVDDDDEFDNVADFFDDALANETDYDAGAQG